MRSEINTFNATYIRKVGMFFRADHIVLSIQTHNQMSSGIWGREPVMPALLYQPMPCFVIFRGVIPRAVATGVDVSGAPVAAGPTDDEILVS